MAAFQVIQICIVENNLMQVFIESKMKVCFVSIIV